MNPESLKTKIFLDSGDPKETKETLALLGFLDGQTTNPSLIAKNPEAIVKKFTEQEIYKFYKEVVTEISAILPSGSVSIEVYADATTTAEHMLLQARQFFAWIPNAHIKFPTTTEGLKAAEICISEGMRVNMTLVFSQEQAAAVYAVTKGAKKGDVFVSPFVGRLDDKGERGMDLVKNILEMYRPGDGHVEVLAASIRSLEHTVETLSLGCHIITAPEKAYKEWLEAGKPMSLSEIAIVSKSLKPINYIPISLEDPWQSYNTAHELTDKGIAKFAEDWNGLLRV